MWGGRGGAMLGEDCGLRRMKKSQRATCLHQLEANGSGGTEMEFDIESACSPGAQGTSAAGFPSYFTPPEKEASWTRGQEAEEAPDSSSLGSSDSGHLVVEDMSFDMLFEPEAHGSMVFSQEEIKAESWATPESHPRSRSGSDGDGVVSRMASPGPTLNHTWHSLAKPSSPSMKAKKKPEEPHLIVRTLPQCDSGYESRSISRSPLDTMFLCES